MFDRMRAEAWAGIVLSRFSRPLDCGADLQATGGFHDHLCSKFHPTSCHLINLASGEMKKASTFKITQGHGDNLF